MQSPTSEIRHSADSHSHNGTAHPANSDMSCPSRRIRLGIYFNAKKRRQFVAPLFTQSQYDVAHPHDGAAVRVDVVVIESDEELDSMVRDALCTALQCNAGPFDILLLKLTDAMTCARYSTDTAARIAAQESLRRVHDSIARQRLARPLTLVESFERVAAVLDRAAIQTLVRRVTAETPGQNGGEGAIACDMPDAFLYQRAASSASSAAAASSSPSAAASALPSDSSFPMAVHHTLPSSLRFPVICKSVAACGSAASHRMYVLQRPEDFDLVHAHESVHATVPPAPSGAQADGTQSAPSPVWLVQQYVNHAGVLYKVYALEEEVHVVAKASLPDVHADSAPSYLNSQDMVLHPLGATSPHAAAPAGSATATLAADASQAHAERSAIAVPHDVLAAAHACARQLRHCLQLSLFGFDLIRSSSANPAPVSAGSSDGNTAVGRCYLVDVNYFPSYKTLTDLPAKLIAICLARHHAEGGLFTPSTDTHTE